MSLANEIIQLPQLSGDQRVRVFRRSFQMEGEFEGMEVDAYVIFTQRFVIVLDTLLCPEDMATVMQQVQQDIAGRQLLVVNSHADWDHAWGNSYFTGSRVAPIIAHDYSVKRFKSSESHKELQEFQQRYPLFRNVVLTPPTLTFSHMFTIHGGDLTLELHTAPGHCNDHIAAFIPELRLLLAFDTVERPLPMIGDVTGVRLLQQTLENLLALQPERVLCSHGNTTSVDMLRKNLAYLQEIERRARLFLAKHQPVQVELEHAAELIGYPFDEVVANETVPVDRTFYNAAHENNIRYTLQWLTA